MNNNFDIGLIRRLRGVLRLAEAAAEALAAQVDLWQYAVRLEVLRNYTGMTVPDVRWLVQRGLAEHRVETTKAGAKRRTFRRDGRLNPAAPVCFVLSAAGIDVARSLCDAAASSSKQCDVPKWDAQSGDWTWRRMLVKHVPASASAQRKVLDQCELGGWAEIIDSPFVDMAPRERSHYLGQVLNNLNRGQKEARIHFSAFEKGRRFRWAEARVG